MKIVILGNQTRAMVNFWTPLLRRLVADGHDALCLVPPMEADDDPLWGTQLADLGVRVKHYPLERKGLNPLADLRTVMALTRILREEKPDRLFSYTIKPVIYGNMAAALARQPKRQDRLAMITGLGYMFEADTLIKKGLRQVARLLYRVALECCGGVVFQNNDDWALFEKLSIIPRKLPVHLSRGTGVDTQRFCLAPAADGPPVFLYIGRLVEAKGLREFIQAASLVRTKRPDAEFHVLGPAEPGPGAVPLDDVLAAQAAGVIRYLGESRDVRPHIAGALAVVLPSWREGTPCSLLEAMSCGRAVVAADAPGSREVVYHEDNGLLVPVKHAPSLAQALLRLLDKPETALRMGERGRQLAEDEFSATAVTDFLLGALRVNKSCP